MKIEEKIKRIKYLRMTFPERFISDYMKDMKEIRFMNSFHYCYSRFWVKDDKIVFEFYNTGNLKQIYYRNRDLYAKIRKYFNNNYFEVNKFVLKYFCREINYNDISNISCSRKYDTNDWSRIIKKHKEFNENIYR